MQYELVISVDEKFIELAEFVGQDPASLVENLTKNMIYRQEKLTQEHNELIFKAYEKQVALGRIV